MSRADNSDNQVDQALVTPKSSEVRITDPSVTLVVGGSLVSPCSLYYIVLYGLSHTK